MEKGIGNGGKASFGHPVIGQDRLAADIAGSGDQWRTEILEQQMMQRAVRQHGADFAAIGCDFRRQVAGDVLRHQHNRADRIAQHVLVGRIQHGCAAKRGKVGLKWEHHGERLVGAPFAYAQSGDRGGTRRIAKQMITADPFDRDDLARSQCGDRRTDGVSIKLCIFVQGVELQTRSTLRAGDRLSMKSPVAWIGIFSRAQRTQLEACHRRIGAVIGQALNQGVTWAALGAIDEGIAEAPILLVFQFDNAVVAGKVVRRHVNFPRAFRFTGTNLKILDGLRRDRQF